MTEEDVNQISVEDAYALLKLEVGASDAQIKSAYRKLSLKLHPDKRRDVDPVIAGQEFHRLALAHDLLSDPVKRAAAEQKATDDAAARARRGAYDGKRRAAAEDLDKREEEDRKRRKAEAGAKASQAQKLERIREENLKMMAEAQRKRAEALAQAQPAAPPPPIPAKKAEPPAAAEAPPALGPLDTTVILKFPTEQLKELTGLADLEDPAAQLGALADQHLCTPLGRSLSSAFGPLDALSVRPPKRKKTSGKLSSESTAAATFASVEDAYAAVSAGQNLSAPGLLQDCWIGWAAAGKGLDGDKSTGEPERIRWLRERGQLGASAAATPEATSPSYESATLERLRAAQRKQKQQNLL